MAKQARTLWRAQNDVLQPALSLKVPNKSPIFEGAAALAGLVAGIGVHMIFAVDSPFANGNVQS